MIRRTVRKIRSAPERGANARDRVTRVAEHHLRLKPQDAEPEGGQALVSAAVTAALPRMVRPVYFHDQPCRRSEEVHDALGYDDLPAKLHAQLTCPQRPPEPSFRLRRSLPQSVSARLKKLLTTQLVECGQGASERPAWGRVQRPQAQDL